MEKSKVKSALISAISNNKDITLTNPKIRWVLFIFMNFCALTEMYLVDLPMPLSYYLQNVDMHLTSFQYNLLYTIFSSPNIVLSICVGYLIDKFGTGTILVVVWLFALAGQIMIFLGGHYLNYWLIFVGRFFSGIGAENDFVCRMILVGDWFLYYEISLSLGFNMICGRFGTNTVGLITPYLYNIRNNLFWPLLFPLILTVISLICAIIIWILDKKYVVREPNELQDTLIEKEALENNAKEVRELEIENQSFAQNIEGKITISSKTLDKKMQGFNCKKLKKLGFLYWAVLLIISFWLGSFYAFVGNSYDLLCSYYNLSPENAGLIMFLAFVLSVSGPIFGLIVDKYGGRLYLLLSGVTLYALIMISTIYWPEPNLIVIPYLFVGISFSIYGCTAYALLRAILKPELTSIGNGLISSIFNLFIVLNTMIFGKIKDLTEYKEEGFFYPFWFLASESMALILISIIIIAYNAANKLKLNKAKMF